MKQFKITILFIVLMNLTGTIAFAYDIAVANDDGVTIYYNYIKDGKELEITRGIKNFSLGDIGSYSGNFIIPEQVTYMNRTRKVTSISEYAFNHCIGLTSVTIPNSVTYIGEYAFWCCYDLTSVTIPGSVTSIGSDAFYCCSGLTSVTIPNSVTYIGNAAFWGCSGLTSITIPNSVTSIGSDAFFDCSGLTSVTIPNSVTSIGNWAFCNCSGLISIIIPNSVTSIGDLAFAGCSGLTSVTIPNSVTYIGESAFEYCKGLTSVVSIIKEPFIIAGKSSDSRTFDLDVFNNITLYVPKGTIDKYKSTTGWKDFLFIEEWDPSSVTSLVSGEHTDKETVYSIGGEKLQSLTKGVNIIKMKDGTVKKVFVK